jgi:hypothetical protein
MRSHRAGCAYVAGANFDLSNITKKGRTTPKNKLINQLVRLAGSPWGCKLRWQQVHKVVSMPRKPALVAANKKWHRWKPVPLQEKNGF